MHIYKTCPKCLSVHQKPGVFCSRSCANSRGPRNEQFKNDVRNKLSFSIFPYSKVSFPNCSICEKLFVSRGTYLKKICSKECNSKSISFRRKGVSVKKSHYKGKPIKQKQNKIKIKTIFNLVCVVCHVNFQHTTVKKTCSKECHYYYLSTCTGHTKKYYYTHKNNSTIMLGSSWELAMAKWLDANNIDWIRPKSIKWIDFNGKNHKYYPDFYLTKYNIYLDPKNPRKIIEDKEKLEIVSKEIVLYYGSVKDIVSKIMVLAEGAAPSRLK